MLLQSIMVFTGIALAWIYERRANLVANIAAHMAFNAIGVLLIFAAR
jgi:membrane protease YdiL (CAAX protease family)